jgi:N6-adenosine-specific RNA methylase IME4
MPTGLELLKRWGFEYKTIFLVWCKTTAGGQFVCSLGNYTRSASEFLLLGVRGSIVQWKQRSDINQVLVAKRREHSRKPDEARQRVDSWFPPGLRRIELFARERAVGWDAWGDETDKFSEESC